MICSRRDNPEGYAVSRPNLGANTSVLAQTKHKHHSLRGPARARLAAYLRSSRDPFFTFLWRQLARRLHPILLRGSNRGRDRRGTGDPDATDVDTDVGTDNDPALPLQLQPRQAA